jgi:hypothetical protein
MEFEIKDKYEVRRYRDDKVIGHSELTSDQFLHYKSMSQQPQGIMHLGAMPHDFYNLENEFQDMHEDTVIYLI